MDGSQDQRLRDTDIETIPPEPGITAPLDHVREEEKAAEPATGTVSVKPAPVAVEAKAPPLVAAPVSPGTRVGGEAPAVAVNETIPAPAANGRKVDSRGFNGLKLQGVLYSAGNPMVIINGKTLRRGESIQGVRVADINRQGARLEFAGESRFLQLPQ